MTSGDAGQTNGLLMDKRGEVTEVGDVKMMCSEMFRNSFMEEVEFIPT